MPLVCIACAVDLISDSETLQPYAFQSLKPICGVSASPLPSARAGCAVPRETRGTPRQSSATEKANANVVRRDSRGNGGKRRPTLLVIMCMSLTPGSGQHGAVGQISRRPSGRPGGPPPPAWDRRFQRYPAAVTLACTALSVASEG